MKVEKSSQNLKSAKRPLICLITDGTAAPKNFAEKKKNIIQLVKAAVEAKISLIQVREKNIPARMVFEIVLEAVECAENSATKILVNDRADIALAANADGVHLTSVSVSAAVIRKNYPANFIVGVSAHTFEEIEKAQEQSADFAFFSPIYASSGKGEPQGIERLRKVCERLKPFSVIALGGIDETNLAEILSSGADGFAAIRFLNDKANLRKLSAKFYGT